MGFGVRVSGFRIVHTSAADDVVAARPAVNVAASIPAPSWSSVG